MTTAHFHAVNLGPTSSHSCDIIYDLYRAQRRQCRPPGLGHFTTNGFGGSKNDASGEAALWADHDYEVLSYSGLGFGDSSCPIELDSPEWDGRAASQLVTWLGSSAHPEVLKDNVATNDPRIGTWVAPTAAASSSHWLRSTRESTPWSLRSPGTTSATRLSPNNYSANLLYNQLANPGVEKIEWSSLFFAEGQSEPAMHPGLSGFLDNVAGVPGSGTINPLCPGFDQERLQLHRSGHNRRLSERYYYRHTALGLGAAALLPGLPCWELPSHPARPGPDRHPVQRCRRRRQLQRHQGVRRDSRWSSRREGTVALTRPANTTTPTSARVT